MRVGVISDVHANRVALDAVLSDVPAVDALVCAGDVVGYNPWPAECVDALRGATDALPASEAGVPTVMGNHDRMIVRERNFRGNPMARAGVDHARMELDDDQRAWLASLPTEWVGFDGRVKVVHGHPADPDHYTRPHEFSPELLEGEDVLVMGHTHVQSHESYEEGIVMNPGSVGQPRDGDPRASYAVLDLDALAVEERRVEYNVDAVAAAVEAAGLPDRTAKRLVEGR